MADSPNFKNKWEVGIYNIRLVWYDVSSKGYKAT